MMLATQYIQCNDTGCVFMHACVIKNTENPIELVLKLNEVINIISKLLMKSFFVIAKCQD